MSPQKLPHEATPELARRNHPEQPQEVQPENEVDQSNSSSHGNGDEDQDEDEYVDVDLADVRKNFQCPICLGIIRKTRAVMEYMHRFCKDCIEKSMRLGKNECPVCRTHCASRTSLREDSNFDVMISLLFPDEKEEELAMHENEISHNKKTLQCQTKALDRKRKAKATAVVFARKSRNLKNASELHISNDNEVMNDEAGNDLSCGDGKTENKPKNGGERETQFPQESTTTDVVGTTDPSSSPPLQTTSRRTRGVTRLRDTAIKRIAREKLPVDVDPHYGRVSGPHKTTFISYLGVLAREKINILVPSWAHVEESVKNMIWQDILANFDVDNTPKVRNKILSSVAKKFRAHKANLTKRWVLRKNEKGSPCARYNIDPHDWETFKKIRNDPSWQPIRKRAQDSQKKNVAPHRLSRGGYDRLEKKIMADKLKKRQEEAAQSGVDAVVDPPSPPPPHLKWKMARTKPSGQMTSEAASQIRDKIDLLEERNKQGLFFPQGSQDILNIALGRPKHLGCVRTAGGDVTIKYSGPRSRVSTTSFISPQKLEHLMQQITLDITLKVTQEVTKFTQSITEKVTQEVKQRTMLLFGQQLQPLGIHSQQVAPIESNAIPVPCVSTKRSCATAGDPLGKEPQIDILERCELCVDENPLRVVALGRVHQGGLTIHHVPLTDDLVRVVVEEVWDVHAPVPIPTVEIKLVGQAIKTFVAWPRHLVRAISTKVTQEPKKEVEPVDSSKPKIDPIIDLVDASKYLVLKDQTFQVECDASVFGVNNFTLYIAVQDIYEIVQRRMMLNIAVIHLWMLYMDEIRQQSRHDHLYGFLEPQSIQKTGNEIVEAQNYIHAWIQSSKKQFYLAPYIYNSHWQLLILCPTKNIAVWLCSLHKKPSAELQDMVQGALPVNNMMDGRTTTKSRDLHWILPKCNEQQGGFECGYYVMHWMSLIIQMGIKNNWEKMFGNPSPLPDSRLEEIRVQWANFFLKKFRNKS